jgi:lantibiotic modifying enzyme
MSAGAMSSEKALEVAATIGFGISRKAIWSGERCSWLDGYAVYPGQNTAVSAMVNADVYGGTAGIGLFLAQAAARTDDALLRRTALGALRQTAARSEDLLAAAPHGFYGGAAGTAAALILAGLELGDEEAADSGRALIGRIPTDIDDPMQTDLISGLAGDVVSFALAAAVLGERDGLAARAAEAARNLIARGERGGDGSLSWATTPDRRANLAGFGHGAAGIAFALLVLDAFAPDAALRTAASAAIRYESGLFDPVHSNWPDFRIMAGAPAAEPTFPVAWCHGAGGIAFGRLAAAAAGLDAAADIDAALASTAREAQRALAAPGSDFTLCHGVLGLADVLLEAGRAGRADAAPALDSSIVHAVALFHDGERPWPSGLITREEISGLMMGNAGIGHFFLRLADPALESVLAPGARLIEGPGGAATAR